MPVCVCAGYALTDHEDDIYIYIYVSLLQLVIYLIYLELNMGNIWEWFISTISNNINVFKFWICNKE